ncbi:MAG: hypothetical protein IJ759_05965 [Bacteroidales bacterium]|nr:hypothetical protein [Bacteroidales bacterium]
MQIDDNNKKHYIRINGYTNQIQAIFDKYNKEFAKLGLSVDYDKENGLFYFRDFPEINNKADKLFKEFANEINTVIANGVSNEWNEANLNNNQIVQSMLGNAWQNAQYSKYFNNHIPAKEAFLKRKTNGLNLSQKVWKYTEVYKENIEDCLSVGIEKGTSAAKLSREIRQYLNEPNKLFRRVRDEFGELRLSKNAKAYNPGAGVYRSSYKNAMRLTRTEINMAYRYADYERWQDMDFVIGIEIQLSGSHPKYDICDTLQGKYPKTFKFGGWHVQCLCFATPILMTDEQFLNEDNADEITDLPQNFKDWYEYHKDDITKAKERGKLPYFLKDNQGVIGRSKNIETRNNVFSYVANLEKNNNNIFKSEKLATGEMEINYRVAKDFMQNEHTKSNDARLLLLEIGDNADKLQLIPDSFRELDLNKPINNLNAKIKRGVIGYRLYKYTNENALYIIQFEDRLGKYEIPYAVVFKKKKQ